MAYPWYEQKKYCGECGKKRDTKSEKFSLDKCDSCKRLREAMALKRVL